MYIPETGAHTRSTDNGGEISLKPYNFFELKASFFLSSFLWFLDCTLEDKNKKPHNFWIIYCADTILHWRLVQDVNSPLKMACLIMSLFSANYLFNFCGLVGMKHSWVAMAVTVPTSFKSKKERKNFKTHICFLWFNLFFFYLRRLCSSLLSGVCSSK